MGATAPSPSFSFLPDLRPLEYRTLLDHESHGRLLDRLLLDLAGVDAFALFRFEPDRAPDAVAASGYGQATLRRFAHRLTPPSHRGEQRIAVPAARVLGEDPAALVAADECPPRWVLPLGREAESTGMLIVAGELGSAAAAALGDVLPPLLSMEGELDGLLRAHEFVCSMLRNVSTGLIAVDAFGRVIFLNPAAEAILGVTERAAIGADCLRVFRTLVDGENVLIEGLDGDVEGGEIWLRRADGREIPVELRLSRIQSKGGEVMGAVAIFQDISEIRSMQERVRHRDRLATIGELAAGIAHEIGNPLTGIRGCAQILRDRLAEGDPSHELIGVILEEVDRLSRLANQVRTYVRPAVPRMQRGSVIPLVDRVLALVQPAIEETGIAVHREEAAELPEIYHDPDQIQQVLHNLVQNASEAMARSGGRLEIEVKAVKRPVVVGGRTRRRAGDRLQAARRLEREYVRIRVSDTGPGIPSEIQSRIFNPFFTTKPDGLGLGLSISQTIVGEHAGYLSLVSQIGKGTTFTLDLPVDRRMQ